jgi:hypothetical protein
VPEEGEEGDDAHDADGEGVPQIEGKRDKKNSS